MRNWEHGDECGKRENHGHVKAGKLPGRFA